MGALIAIEISEMQKVGAGFRFAKCGTQLIHFPRKVAYATTLHGQLSCGFVVYYKRIPFGAEVCKFH